MNVKEARAAIEAILAAIADDDLPKFDSVEVRGETEVSGSIVVWWGGNGRHLGTARTNGERDPISYRHDGSWDAIEGEMAYRADRAFLANGDRFEGAQIRAKRVR